jgi:type II secretory pathway pseudopilin PulG
MKVKNSKKFRILSLGFRASAARRRGQALIESIVALSVLTVGLLGIIALLSQSIGLNRSVSDNYAATYLAAEGIEVVKNIIDANQIQGRAWNYGLNDGTYEVQYDSTALAADQGRFLRYDPAANLYGYGPGNPTTFKRGVTITRISDDELRVVSRVTWTTRGAGSFEIVLEDHFFRWRL